MTILVCFCHSIKGIFKVTLSVGSLICVAINIYKIHAECKRFGKAYSLRSVAVYGGGSMWEQAKALQEGAEIVVCTPVRSFFFIFPASKGGNLCCSVAK